MFEVSVRSCNTQGGTNRDGTKVSIQDGTEGTTLRKDQSVSGVTGGGAKPSRTTGKARQGDKDESGKIWRVAGLAETRTQRKAG